MIIFTDNKSTKFCQITLRIKRVIRKRKVVHCFCHAMPARHHSVFYRPDALPAAQPTASRHWRQQASKLKRGGPMQALCEHWRVVGMDGVSHVGTDHQRLGDGFLERRRVVLVGRETAQNVLQQWWVSALRTGGTHLVHDHRLVLLFSVKPVNRNC